jgi:glucose-1-phosphate thymidylyltransferase
MRCFILAGGFATRLWPLTERRAKPLLPLKGKPILDHVADAVPDGVHVSVSTNAAFEDDMRRWAKGRKRKVSIVVEDAGHDDQKLGALGALAKWIEEEKVDDDVLLLAGDNYCECDMGAFVSMFRGNPLLAAHDLGDPGRAKAFGTVVFNPSLEPGTLLRRVTEFQEKPPQPKSSCVSAGWWILPKSALPVVLEYAKKKPDNVGGIFEELLSRGTPVDCYVFAERWKDIGSFNSYMDIHQELVGGKPLVDESAEVDEASKLLGSVSIGPETSVRASTLTDCIVFGEADIEDCVLERCIIDEGCVLKGVDLTGKMLRSGTVLKRG